MTQASHRIDDLLAALSAGQPATFTADQCRVIANEVTTGQEYLRDVPKALLDLTDRAVRAEIERDELKAAIGRVRELHTLDGHGPIAAGGDTIDGDAWCEAGCHLDDDSRCPTLLALEGTPQFRPDDREGGPVTDFDRLRLWVTELADTTLWVARRMVLGFLIGLPITIVIVGVALRLDAG